MGLKINRCFDVAVIYSMSTRKDIFTDLHEDDYQSKFPDVVNNIYLTPTIDGTPVGWVMITRIRKHTYEGHILILPEYRKEYAKQSVFIAMKWILENLKDLRKINTIIPEKWANIIAFFEGFGFIKEGYMRQSYLKDGELIGEYMYGITADEIKEVLNV